MYCSLNILFSESPRFLNEFSIPVVSMVTLVSPGGGIFILGEGEQVCEYGVPGVLGVPEVLFYQLALYILSFP